MKTRKQASWDSDTQQQGGENTPEEEEEETRGDPSDTSSPDARTKSAGERARQRTGLPPRPRRRHER